MSVIVSGGLGFIGSHVVDLLVSDGYSVAVVDNGYSGSEENLSAHIGGGKVEVLRLDIRDFEKLSGVLRGADFEAFVHLAAVVSVDEFLADPHLGFDVNVMGTLNVAEACRRFEVDKIVFSSSTAVYGDPVYLPVDEKHPTEPKNPYGASKLAGEKLLFSYSKTYGVKVVSLRYFNVYGPRMRPGPYAGVIYKFIESILHGRPLNIQGDGSQTRDFVYVRDVAEATVRAINYQGSDVFNVGTGVSVSIRGLADLLMDLTGRDVGVVYSDERPGDIRYSEADISKIRERMGWEPKYDLSRGLVETLRYFEARF